MELDIVKSAEIQNYLQKIRSSTNTGEADNYLNKKADFYLTPFTISSSLLFKVQSLYGEGNTYYVEGTKSKTGSQRKGFTQYSTTFGGVNFNVLRKLLLNH